MRKQSKKTFTKNNIEPLRIERGLTQRALGKLANTTGPTINRVEKSQRGLDVDDLFLYARLLGVHPSKIVDMSEFEEKAAEFDQTVLGMIIGWLLEASEKDELEVPGKKLGEWASFAYKEIIEQDMPFQEMRKYCYDLVKLHSGKKARK